MTELSKNGSDLIEGLRKLPDEALLHLQYLQTQVGCPNICAMCSQGASKNITAMTRKSVHDLMNALKTVVDERFPNQAGVLGGGREEHKPGVIFPYLDTDIGSDRNLFDLIGELDSKFKVKARIATVGYSRHNKDLQEMHTRIATELPHAIDGFRVSITPYTYGLHDREGLSARSEYVQDVANLLRTYRPLLNEIGAGKEKFAVELRHKPHVRVFDTDLDVMKINDHHVIRSGPHLLLGLQPGTEPRVAALTALTGRSAEFSEEALPYMIATSDQFIGEGDWKSVAELFLENKEEVLADTHPFGQQYFDDAINIGFGDGYAFENADRIFYSIDPTFKDDGHFAALNFYPKGNARKVSGYNDASRHLLNAILDYKKSKSLSRRDHFAAATWEDVMAVIAMLQAKANRLKKYDERAGKHIEGEILPLVQTYIDVLRAADFEPHYFFNRNFTIDTGQIVNQGRAITQFKGLATKEDESMTAHDMRGYGKDVSYSAMREHVWRIAPLPLASSSDRIQLGYKNPASTSQTCSAGSISVSKLGRFDLYPVETIIIEGVEVERIAVEDARKAQLLPGMPNPKQGTEKSDTLPTVTEHFQKLALNEENLPATEEVCAALQADATKEGIDVHVVCGIIMHGNNVLVVTRAMTETLAPGSPEMPGGGVDAGEKLMEALRRELSEEVGSENMSIERYLGYFDITYNETKTRQFTFVVRVDSDKVRLNPDEHMSHEWVDLSQDGSLEKFAFHSPGEEAMVKRVQLGMKDATK